VARPRLGRNPWILVPAGGVRDRADAACSLPRPHPADVTLAAALALAALLAGAPGQEALDTSPTHPGEVLRISLITAEPGTAVWERFGHNALRIRNVETGADISYNWGIFDFQQVDFVPRFLRGEMLYMMAPFRTAPMLDSYRSAGRRIMIQELALTPEQRWSLLEALEENALPQNREYFYDYFLDNCSTRVRDALDAALGGLLRERFVEEPTGTSYRFHTRRLTRMDPLVYAGMDVLLGSPGDQPISVWEEMFLPMTLMEELRSVEVAGPQGPRPLVSGESVLDPGTPQEAAGERPWGPEEPPTRVGWFLLAGLAVGGLMVRMTQRAVRGSYPARVGAAALALLWTLVSGVVGTILVLVLFTDHQFMAWNENLFVMNPLSAALTVLAPLALLTGWASGWARRLAWTVLGVAVVGLLVQPLPFLVQQNALFFALALPLHTALAWTLTRVGAAGGDEPATPAR